MGRKKRQVHEEHENHERWLVSYADFMTLLFAFFVVMYAISSVDQKRAKVVEESVRWALNVAGKGGGGDLAVFPETPEPGSPEIRLMPSRSPNAGANQIERMRATLERNIGRGAARPGAPLPVLVQIDGRRVVVRVSALSLFDPGGIVLRPSALPTLDALLETLGPMNMPLRVEGHTDDRPPTGRVESNWALSAARAAAVVEYAIATTRIPPARFSLSSFGSTRPIADNATPEGRERNRRIDLVVDFEQPTATR